MKLPIVYHPHYEAPLKPGHRFPMSKYGYLREALAERGLMPPGGFLAPAEASAGVVELAHDPAYVARVFSQSLEAPEVKRIGLPNSERMTRRVRLSAAGTTLAGRLALEHGIAMNAAGGSHHAAREGGSGYCVFNDVAVAAAALLADGVIRRALVVDLDVHQGDGTARIFEGDTRVFTLSLHAEKNFPTEKAASDLDVPLADGLEDDDYLAALDAALERVETEAFDVIFYNAGVDVVAEDRLGRLALTADGLRRRDARVIDWARARSSNGGGAPLVGVLGGGYGPDPRLIAARHAVMFEEAAKAGGETIWGYSPNSGTSSRTSPKPRIKAVTRRRSPSPR
ncbi:MAG: histone deacetylase [Pseudomonadota bacterium]